VAPSVAATINASAVKVAHDAIRPCRLPWDASMISAPRTRAIWCVARWHPGVRVAPVVHPGAPTGSPGSACRRAG